MTATPGRRAVLAGLAGSAVLPLVGCEPDGPAAPAGPVGPDPAARAEALRLEDGLIAAYDAVVRQHPALASRLAPVRADHLVHRAALGGSPPTATPSARPSATARADAADADPARALVALLGLERSAAARLQALCGTTSTALAPVLASVAACELSHGVVLE